MYGNATISTEEIRLGLEKIKKAQEQVLLELRKDQPQSTTDTIKVRASELATLRKQLKQSHQKLQETDQRYTQRITELQAQLNHHQEQEKGLRNKLTQIPTKQLQQFANILQQKDALVREKIHLLKINTQLESENIQLKNNQHISVNNGEIIKQLTIMNTMHENIINEQGRLSPTQIDDEENYQNALKNILLSLEEYEGDSNPLVDELKRDLEKQKQEKQYYKREIQQIKLMMKKLKEESNESKYEEIINDLNEQMNHIIKEKNNMKGIILQLSNKTQTTPNNSENYQLKEHIDRLILEKEHLLTSVKNKEEKIEELYSIIEKQLIQKENLIQESKQNTKKLQQSEIRVRNNSKEMNQLKENLKKAEMFNKQQMQGQLSQIGQLRKQNETLFGQKRQVKVLRQKTQQLQREKDLIFKQTKQTNSKIDHLWSVKEIQYENINAIISHLKV